MALRAEEIYREIESEGNVSYERVLTEIERRLNTDIVKPEDKQILEFLKLVHENSMYEQIRKNSKILQDEQVNRDAQRNGMQHTSEEISEDLREIARTSSKEDALRQIINSRDSNLTLSDYGFDENGLMFQEYGLEQIASMYEAFKDDFDENGLPLPNEKYEYAGTQLAEIMYNYTRYLKDKAQVEKKKEDENIK